MSAGPRILMIFTTGIVEIIFNKWIINSWEWLTTTNFSEVTSQSEFLRFLSQLPKMQSFAISQKHWKRGVSRGKERIESVKIEGNYDCLKTSP